MTFEQALRAALAAEGVAMGAPGRAAVPAHGPIMAGGRDVAGVSEAGRLSREVRAGRLMVWEAVSAIREFCSHFEGQDKPDTEKFVAKLIEFLLRDSIVRDDKGKIVYAIKPGEYDADGEPVLEVVRRLPYGWCDALTIAEVMQWGLDGIGAAYGERYIARWFILIARTGLLVDTRTGEILPMGVVLNREVGSYVAHHSRTGRKEDTVKGCLALRRVEYAKLLPAMVFGIVKEPPYEVWNTWRGFAVPRVAGVSDQDVEPFLRFVRMLLPDDTERMHLLNWVAHLCQFPGVKMMWAILLISVANGVGKGTLAKCIRDLLHPVHSAGISVEVMRSQFNPWARDIMFLFVDEVQSTDRMDVTNHLKTLITSPEITINQKHVPSYEQPNLVNVMLASNKADAVYLDQKDRRFLVLRIEDEDAARILRDFDFKAFNDWWDNPLNRMKVLGWLLARDLAGFNAKAHAPMTAGKEALLDLTKPRWESVLQDALDAGAGVFGKGVVTAEGVAAFLAEHRQDRSSAHAREWLRRAGLVPVMHRVRVPRAGAGIGTVKATVWAVRDAEHWRTAGREAVLAELARLGPFEGRAERAVREAGGTPCKQEGGNHVPTFQK